MENPNKNESWEEKKQRLLKEYPSLKPEDLEYEAGKEEEMLIRLQEKLGKTRKEIRNWLHILG